MKRRNPGVMVLLVEPCQCSSNHQIIFPKIGKQMRPAPEGCPWLSPISSDCESSEVVNNENVDRFW